jgi:GDPmannose 4,6-dehydratase
MLQQYVTYTPPLLTLSDTPDDFVLATNTTHTVRSFIELAFSHVGRKITWRGSGVEEEGVDDEGNVVVRVDERYFRPAEVEKLLGNPAKAEKLLGWVPSVPFEELVREMVAADIESAKYLVEDLN